MFEKNCHLVDKQLKSVAEDINAIVSVDIQHQYELRRGLLNSSYYSQNFFIRWYNRIFALHRRVLVYTTGVGIVVVSVFTFTIYNNNEIIAQNTAVPYVKTVQAQELPTPYLQELYKYGYVSYSHEESDGCRIYKADNGNKKMMIRDDEPYSINVVLAN